MADPYNGQFATAGNPYVTATGEALGQYPDTLALYQRTWGADAAKVWAQEINQRLLSSGQALMTSQGVVPMSGVMVQLQSSGYTGPTDIQSVSNAFNMLHTPKPASLPTPASVPGVTAIGGLNVGSLPTPVLVGGGLLLLLLLGGRGRLL